MTDLADTPPAGRRTIERTGLTNQVYEAIKEQILDQTVRPGSRINIDLLVAELGVSSTPIREALARLHSERLVSFEPYIGYSAAPIHDDGWFHDMIDFRAMLEGSAADVGGRRRDKSVVAALERAFASMNASGLGQHYRKYSRFNAADAEFHQTIVASANNQVFSQAYQDLQPHIHYARLYLSRGVEEEAQVTAEHQAILKGFRDGDGTAARNAVIAHLEAARSRLLKSAAIARARVGEARRPKKR
jgi:DNA-binding GntR family transcriptional regulator